MKHFDVWHYELEEPKDSNHLAYVVRNEASGAGSVNGGAVVEAEARKSTQGFWHSTAKRSPVCAGAPLTVTEDVPGALVLPA